VGSGTYGPAGTSIGFTLGTSGVDSVEDLEGLSSIIGASGGAPISLGADVSMPSDSDNLMNDSVYSISMGVGGSAEVHTFAAYTQVAGTEIDISQAAGALQQFAGKVGEGIKDLPSVLLDNAYSGPLPPDLNSMMNP
ncbi:hypothetical protein S1OALGB6SA_1054, partial [Olavius algarvensis spirochete endosymbiont]|uniref:hypothetical protein n=1 Tax=Olavius algarvensis spirochete endosymbiont TaxID=260710 RepID=UPI000F1E1553